MMRQRLRDALLLQAKALCALVHEADKDNQTVVLEESASSGSSSADNSSAPPLSSVASDFIACATTLRR